MAASGILDLRSHFGLERPQVEPEEEEEEPVHPLDLRICKVNESISRNNHASNNVFNDALQARHQESEAGEVVAQASNTTSVSPPVATTIDSLRLRSPMQSAFPGQIPPDRRYSEASSPQGHHHPYEQNPMLTLRPLNELQAKVQQHMQQHRYHPYGDYKHIRQQVSSGNDHQRQTSGGNPELLAPAGAQLTPSTSLAPSFSLSSRPSSSESEQDEMLMRAIALHSFWSYKKWSYKNH